MKEAEENEFIKAQYEARKEELLKELREINDVLRKL
jgi:hypothetical protein